MNNLTETEYTLFWSSLCNNCHACSLRERLPLRLDIGPNSLVFVVAVSMHDFIATSKGHAPGAASVTQWLVPPAVVISRERVLVNFL